MLTSPAEIRAFAKAGNATLTLRSTKTDRHFTYKVSKVPDAEDKFFISLLSGPDNETNFSYLGLMTCNQFRTTAKSCASSEAPSAKAFSYFCRAVLQQEVLPSTLEVRHEGRCGRCNRKLTTPESLDRGIGPECWSRL